MAAASRSLWRERDFLKLWGGQTISQVGTQITFLALPLAAILVLDASPFEVGLLGTFEFLPFLLLGLPAGVWVDRMRRRPILVAADIGRMALLGTIPLAHALDALHMLHLYAVAFAVGICTVFFDVSYQSYLPSLVARSRLVEGNAKLEMSFSGARFAGPGLGGVLVELLSAPIAILADALSYLGSAMFLLRIRRPERRPEPDPSDAGMWGGVREGLQYVLRHSLLRPIAATTAISNLFWSMILALLVLFAVRELDLPPAIIGTVLSLGAVGSLAGALAAGWLARVLGTGPTIVGAILLAMAAPLLVPLATPGAGFPMLVAFGVLTGFGSVVYNVNQVSLRQAITPERMQGRMNATMRFLVWGTLPLGSLLGGALGESLGLRAALWIAVAGGFLVLIPLLASPVRTVRAVEVPEGMDALEAATEDGGEPLAGPRP